MNSENNNENKDGLNAVSLGSIDGGNNLNVPVNDIPPVNPVSPVAPLDEVETLDNLDNNGIGEPVGNSPVTPVQDINQIPNPDAIAPVTPEPMSYDIPDVINNTPVFNDIGTVPPIPNVPVVDTPQIAESATTPKKGGTKKVLFVIVIIIALAAVGMGVYVVLQKANAPKVVTKALKIELGSDISTTITDYATFKNMDSSTCELDTSKILGTTELNAKYDFYVTCEGTAYKGIATIVDTIAPEVVLKEVTVGVNENVSPEDFISECQDKTECSYSFKDEEKVQEYLKTPASYHVAIEVKDAAGNVKEVTGVLLVNEDNSDVYLACSITNNGVLETTRFGIKGTDFNKFITRTYTFTFESKEAYDSFKNENSDKQEVTYNEITGSPTFDDESNTLVLSKKLSYEELNTEAGATVPLSYSDLKGFYENKKYSCTITQ